MHDIDCAGHREGARYFLEFTDGKEEVTEDDWKASLTSRHFPSPKAWKGRTIFKVFPGGIETACPALHEQQTQHGTP